LAVRQGTYAVYLDEQGLANKLYGEAQKELSQNGRLTDDTRAQFMRVAHDKIMEYQKAWQADANQARKAIQGRAGWDEKQVIPEFPDLGPLDLTGISTQNTKAEKPNAPSAPASGRSPGRPPVRLNPQDPEGDFNRLSKGDQYIGPDGVLRTK